MRKLSVADFFSGIGGFGLGFERTGHFETRSFCEIDPYCRAVLAKHWPNVPCHEDIRKLNAEAIGPVDVLVGGFPCQPFSHAGKRGGAEDDRHLWPEMFRLIEALRPSWVVGENVAGLVSMGVPLGAPHLESRSIARDPDRDHYDAVYARQEAMLLNEICEDLESADYDVQPFVIPACGVDAPHRRDRIWIVANASGGRCSGEGAGKIQQQGRGQTFSASEVVAHTPRVQSGRVDQWAQRQRAGAGGEPISLADPQGDTARGLPQRAGAEIPGPRSGGEDVANAIGAGCPDLQGRGAASGDTGKQALEPDGGAALSNAHGHEQHRRCSPLQMGRLRRAGEAPIDGDARGAEWSPEPGVGRVAHGVSHRVDRLKDLGNAVVPDIPEAIAWAIAAAEGRCPPGGVAP